VIRCRVARRSVDAALERELALEERFQLDEHTSGCRACAEYERRARGLQELLEGPGDPSPTTADVDAAAQAVFARLAGGGTDGGEGEVWRPRRARRGALIAGGALALAAAVLLLLLRGRHAPVPDAGVTPEIAETSASRDWTPAGVEVTVRAALLDGFGLAGADEVRARERFCAGTREVAQAGWPVRRFVEGLLESPDATVVLAAARCLGNLGEAGAVPALARALVRRETADIVLDALGALGEPAVSGLEPALSEPELAVRALRQLCRISGPRVAAVLERAARLARAGSNPSREALLDALTTTGLAAVSGLLRLAAESAGERNESTAILARLAFVNGAGPELVHALERERFPGDLAYRALLFLQPVEALPWLEEQCVSHRERAFALEALASFPDTGPLASALRLAQAGRVPREDVKRLLVGLFERDAERTEIFTRALIAQRSEALRSWLELLIESEHPGAARALVPLAFCESLAPDDRQWAALAVGELGTAEDAELLLGELGTRAAGDRRLTAACLLSIHARLGAQGVERLLASCSQNNLRRVLGALESEGSGEAVLVHRVARALDGALAELAVASADPKDTL
jgi:hypothetical protein